MRRHKSLTVKRSDYYSLASSTSKLPSRAAQDYNEYKLSSSLNKDLTALLSKSKTSSAAKSLRRSHRVIPSYSGSSTPKAEERTGSYSTKAAKLRSSSGPASGRSAGGIFVFPKEEDPNPRNAWMPRFSSSREPSLNKPNQDSGRISRPVTGRNQAVQNETKPTKPKQLLQDRKDRRDRRDREAKALASVLFKKTSRLDKKPAQIELNAMVTKVAQTQPQPKPVALTPEEQQAHSERIYREHLFQTFQALKCVRSLAPPDPSQLKQKRVTIEKRIGFDDKKTMIFDLDETLVHCNDNLQTSDVVLPVRFPTGELISVRYT